MPTTWLVSCLEELLPVMTCILNSFLALGHFPSKWKDTLVDPHMKKAGKDISFADLHPISNLQFVSKLSILIKFELYRLHYNLLIMLVIAQKLLNLRSRMTSCWIWIEWGLHKENYPVAKTNAEWLDIWSWAVNHIKTPAYSLRPSCTNAPGATADQHCFAFNLA